MSCFSSTAVSERDELDQIREQLLVLKDIHENAAFPSIITKDGYLLATLLNEETMGIDLTSTISAVHNAARHFATIMKLTGCPFLRLGGDTQIFYLYKLHGDHVLVFFNNKECMGDCVDMDEDDAKDRIKIIAGKLDEILRRAEQEESK